MNATTPATAAPALDAVLAEGLAEVQRWARLAAEARTDEDLRHALALIEHAAREALLDHLQRTLEPDDRDDDIPF